MQWFLSPDGLSYRSRYTAVQDMIKRKQDVEEVEHMKELMVMHEGWQRSTLLPENWLFKVKSEGFTKDKKWYSSIHYFTEAGETIESFKNVLTKLKELNASEETIEKCNQFIAEQKPADVKYDWQDGDETVPKGWKLRISESEAEWQWMLNPDGKQFRSRYTALLDMIKKKSKRKEVEEMKVLMMKHEGWNKSRLLPSGWLFKVKSEGMGPNNKWYSTIHYLSREGDTFESMKSALDFIQNSEDYTEQDVENGKAFLAEQKAPEKKYEWKDGGDYLPAGWKSRISEGESKMEWFLSPEGRMYRTRYIALVDMVKKGYPDETLMEMKESMILHEGWSATELLPSGWLFKVVWEGFNEDGKWNQTIRFLSKEGLVLESMKSVLELLENPEHYTEEDVDNAKEFMKQQKAPEKKYKWNDGGKSLPKGWKRRVGDGESQWEWVLSPEGKMYRSRFVALQDMIKRQYREEEVAEMRQLLVQEEQWHTDPLLPPDWLYKVKWSGTDESGRLSENITYISSDGQVFESNKSVCDYVRDAGCYSQVEVDNCSEFQRRRVEKRKREGERKSDSEKRRKLEMETLKRKSGDWDESLKKRKK